MTHPWQDIQEKGFYGSAAQYQVGEFQVLSGENVCMQLLEINTVLNNLADQTSS